MERVKKKDLGKKISTEYWTGLFSIKKYEKGMIIKPVKQKPICITNEIGSLLAERIRNKETLFTYKEAKDMIKEEMAQQV